MWRNVIDRPGAYPEYSATAMIATAMLRGIRNGWLDARVYQPLVDRAWQAILLRTGADGRLVDVCESTGTRGMLRIPVMVPMARIRLMLDRVISAASVSCDT